MIASAKLTSKFQVTIPAAVRRRLGIEAGDVVTLTVEGGEVILRAAKGGWTESSRGLGADVWKRAGGGAIAVERERDSWK
ncbi:MAG: AbrB/MazE/SpoVT family DNA-binding domain-containing protein [Acidobacteria bacterium]|nr:AbrB/MazE/SpoVT family DNA-binding domain-containing protein [Acidobacteriota bacterium]